MDTSILEDIGLTGAEIKVFMTLLELGNSTAGLVVEKSGLQNAVVHRAFHSLIEKGLITYIMEGKIKNYQAIDPKLLLNFLDEKRARLEKILPELEAKRLSQKERPRATIFQGVRGVKEMISSLLDTDQNEVIFYGSSKIGNDITGYFFWENFQKRRVKKGLKTRMIFHKSLMDWGNQIKKFKLTEIRYTEENFEELTETGISGDKVAIIVWTEKPMGFLITEELVVRSYKSFFEILWKNAKIK